MSELHFAWIPYLIIVWLISRNLIKVYFNQKKELKITRQVIDDDVDTEKAQREIAALQERVELLNKAVRDNVSLIERGKK